MKKNRFLRYCMKLIILSTFNLFFCLSATFAFQVQPMKMQFNKTGERKAVRIENKLKNPVTVEIEVYEGKTLAKDEKKRKRADDKFLIFPPQAVINPGKAQIAQVSYVGDPVKKKNYIILVKQVPVKVTKKKEGSEVQVVFNFGVLTTVSFKNVQ